jgi:2-polyprenyl-6-methoxyphenol hydroxylase-like FAD-dependent oxidoreductase
MGLSYTTREFVRTTPDHEADSFVVASTVAYPRGGVMLAQPDGRWVVTLGGYLGETAPTDLDGFRAFAQQCASPAIADALDGLTPVGDARTFKYHASSWRRYDRMRRLPEGLLVLGDSICSFNPIFGQGMTVAAREAVALRRCLHDGGMRSLAKRFFALATREIAIPWEIAASSDLRLPAVQGHRSPKTRVTNWYLRHYFRAAQRDDVLGRTFLEVLNLLAPPTMLLAPKAVRRVLRARRATPEPASSQPAPPTLVYSGQPSGSRSPRKRVRARTSNAPSAR